MQRGFTTIDLIITISLVILVIAGDIFAVLYLNQKSRDITVLSEISQTRSALEVFLQFNNFYPKSTNVVNLDEAYYRTEKLCQSGFQSAADSCDKIILNALPNFYQAQGNVYQYRTTADNSYQIQFVLQTNFPEQGLKKGVNCATNNQIISQPCF
ncbi:MAG: hypothetical protein PHC97_04065 [Patescibacteria group bacterium]|nr:hypothetical protein [Patescibacteria group bacterium]